MSCSANSVPCGSPTPGLSHQCLVLLCCDGASVSRVHYSSVVPGCLGSACPVAAAYCEVTTVTLTSSAWFLPLPSGVYKGPLVVFSIFFGKLFFGLK